jgi:alcohol dehydrogenase class IV
MSSYLTASTGLDALCQGIESLWSVLSTDESRMYAKEAVTLAIHNLEKVVNKPDKESRLNMAKAAHLSGKAVNISKTTAAHSISYPITSYFGIPHGHAVALTIYEILEFNYNIKKEDCNDERGVKFVKNRLDDIITLIDCKDEIQAKDEIKNLMEKIGLETKLSKLNIDKKGIELLVKKGFTTNRMRNNPRKIKKEQVKSILERIL